MSGQYFLKITLMGDGAVGKTSLRNRFMGKGFRQEHLMTIGADFAAHEMPIDGSPTTFQIWDLAGQESFRTVRSRFYNGSMGGLMVFDVTRRESFMNVTRWITDLWKNSGRGVVPVVLLGNKADLRDKNSVSNEQAAKYAAALSQKMKKKGFQVYFMETSAKTGLNVLDAFTTLGQQVIKGLNEGTIKRS